MIIKKGAMFGLDARIALAIFGALAVISGAALYSAIQESKVTSLLASISEMEKAYGAYYLDTGSHLEVDSGSVLKIEDLLSSTASGWKGPYSPLERVSSIYLKFQPYESVLYAIYKDDAFGDNVNATTCGAPCYVYVGIYDVPLEIRKKIDLRIDGVEDSQNGRVRLHDYKDALFIKFLKYD